MISHTSRLRTITSDLRNNENRAFTNKSSTKDPTIKGNNNSLFFYINPKSLKLQSFAIIELLLGKSSV